MKKFFLVTGCWLLVAGLSAQTVTLQLQKAFQKFENDSQLKHAISSLYVIDAKTGEVVFDKNSQIGLAPASTQKIITAATAFELLGKEFRYSTDFFYVSKNVFVLGKGDPTFGSWRYKNTIDTVIFNNVINAANKKGWLSVSRFFLIENERIKNIPSRWIYEDIGNYYGAAPFNLNWHENQFDVTFIPGDKAGDATSIDTIATKWWRHLINNCKTGKAGSGDNAYIYPVPNSKYSVIEGTIPAGVKRFTISASDHDPDISFGFAFKDHVYKEESEDLDAVPFNSDKLNGKELLYTHYSPTLDSIVYWFLKKSINLYGESLIATLAGNDMGIGQADSGINIVKKFWKDKGIDEDELNIYDGSGLSPMNRVTTHAQVEILKYAKSKDWFKYFYDGLPEFNGMKMKSGTIGDVKGFCGYHKSKDGKEYIFSFLVNNYSGSGISNKMYKVLDELK
ncbi:MAG: D-alanyl-D-alanine carboxypeptidase/D-alanyl-D-alanine-endopeptidase [Chitinophagaceae bacterium]|nr:D-alanyl-D-alanine carboxypeptidase/D-alanyl-D-alanine-endopeptidase [Chitinophagaceae bacterium]